MKSHLLLTTIAAVVLVGCGESSIHDGASDGNIDAVKKHLAAGADVNAKRGDGKTPLHFAVANDHKELAELLITKGADVNAKAYRGSTSLHYAAFKSHDEIAELLIANGADVNAKEEDGGTPLDKAIFYQKTEFAALLRKHGAKTGEEFSLHVAAGKNGKGDIEIVRKVLAAGTDIDARDILGSTALRYAIYSGHKEIAQLLIDKGADVNAKSDVGRTPLQDAALGGHKEIAELLIAKGADVNEKTNDGVTPLHFATTKEIAELLIAEGADVNAKDSFGQTPLDWAEKLEDYQKRPETKAAKKEIADLLRKHGGKPGETRREELKAESALFNAVFEGNIEAVKKHLDDGVDVNAKTATGGTPLDPAIGFKHTEIADLLRKHGGKTGEELK